MNKEKENIKLLREKFLITFCKNKGWNSEELTTGQMLIIVNQPEYKNPKI
jgi:hypothetical protein